jgi:hypothetical protein
LKKILLPLALAAGLVAGLGAQTNLPRFEVDPAFPQIPAGKVLGDMSSVAVDSHDHIWMIHRPRTVPEARRALHNKWLRWTFPAFSRRGLKFIGFISQLKPG